MAYELDVAKIDAALKFDAEWEAGLRKQWQELMTAVVWDSLEADQIGHLPRLRKRCLELGERTRSLVAPRDWIPHPRERLKSALAAALALRETLAAMDGALAGLRNSSEAARLGANYRSFQGWIVDELRVRETHWAEMLDAQIED